MALPMAAAAAPAFPWGSVISGVGSILGGVLGGKEKKGPSLVDQANASIYHQQMIDRNRPSWIVEGAKAAGIHPLTAMGISPSSGMSFSLPGSGGGTDWGSIAAGMGQDIGNVIDRYRNPVEKTAARLESLTLERGELENELLRSQIAKIRATAIPPQPFINNEVLTGDPRYPTTAQNALGYGDTAPLLREGIDPFTGLPVRVYNDDLGDSELMQAAFFPLALHDTARNLGQRTGEWIRKRFTW